MNKIAFVFLLIIAFSSTVCCGGQGVTSSRAECSKADSSVNIITDSIPAGAKALMFAYAEIVTGFRNDSLIFYDSSSIVFDDRKKKTFVELLDHSDIEDMFSISYDTSQWIPKQFQDAGRVRCESLFRKIYGNSRKDVESHLVTVLWFGQKLRFTSVCGADDSLKAVACEFESKPELHKYLKNASTYYWRKVRGADRLSAHSYGIAIDINTSFSDYWLWASPGKGEMAEIKYKNRIPHEIVNVFERHGFIWGGRWYHFDTMHFEFRPELHIVEKLRIK